MFEEIDVRELEYRIQVIENRLGIDRAGLPSHDSYTPDLLSRIEKIEFKLNIDMDYPKNLEDVLNSLDNRTLQQIFREIDARDLALALLGMKQETLIHIKNNFSHKAWSMMRDDVTFAIRHEITDRELKMAKAKFLNIIYLLESMGEIVAARYDKEKAKTSLQEWRRQYQQETKEKEENSKKFAVWKKEIFDPLDSAAQNA
jgi:hypothetical protein